MIFEKPSGWSFLLTETNETVEYTNRIEFTQRLFSEFETNVINGIQKVLKAIDQYDDKIIYSDRERFQKFISIFQKTKEKWNKTRTKIEPLFGQHKKRKLDVNKEKFDIKDLNKQDGNNNKEEINFNDLGTNNIREFVLSLLNMIDFKKDGMKTPYTLIIHSFNFGYEKFKQSTKIQREHRGLIIGTLINEIERRIKGESNSDKNQWKGLLAKNTREPSKGPKFGQLKCVTVNFLGWLDSIKEKGIKTEEEIEKFKDSTVPKSDGEEGQHTGRKN